MNRLFLYGQSVEDDNFTDRISETERLKQNFNHGVNTILISPRRIGKTSIVKKVLRELDNPEIITVFMDIYDCRDEFDFYNKFSAAVIKSVSSSVDSILKNITDLIGRISPKISVSQEPSSEVSLSLGLTPKQCNPEELLNIPQVLARKKGIHIVVCIDEFQQIGEFPHSLEVQKKMRSIWQHQKDVTYCFFGSKKHMMEKLFGDRKMPFFQFGEMTELGLIPTCEWVKYIKSRFALEHKDISDELASKLCSMVQNHSSYVQQLSWNLFVRTDRIATDEALQIAFQDTMDQNRPCFTEQIRSLSTYQLNFLKALANGITSGFTSVQILSEWHLGSKSSISVIKKALLDKELIETGQDSVIIADPLFKIWLRDSYSV